MLHFIFGSSFGKATERPIGPVMLGIKIAAFTLVFSAVASMFSVMAVALLIMMPIIALIGGCIIFFTLMGIGTFIGVKASLKKRIFPEEKAHKAAVIASMAVFTVFALLQVGSALMTLSMASKTGDANISYGYLLGLPLLIWGITYWTADISIKRTLKKREKAASVSDENQVVAH